MREEQARGAEIDPKGDMRRLASAFPGALRELDGLSLQEIQYRLATLERVTTSPEAVPSWARFASDYHAWVRALLDLRSLLGDDRRDPDARVRARERYRVQFAYATEFDFDETELDAVLTGEGGRMNPWIFARIAREYGTSARDVEDAIFVTHHGRC